jgi:2-desacetyl-2-hydroxyethyl bacteriochlorophyllide A dehydrogenase
MRSAMINQARELEIVDLPEPQLSPSEVRLRVSYCGVCGSDLHLRTVPEIYPDGTVPGHEASGVVIEVGSEVGSLRLGDRVTVNPFNPCGVCPQCLAGNFTHCPTAGKTGMGLGGERPGAYAETVAVEAAMCIPLPDEISDEHAALSEPLAVGVHAVARAEISPGQPTIVIGAGPIGAVTALALRAEGFDDVHLIELSPERRERAAELGFSVSEGIDGYEGDAPAAVFECAGVPQAATLAADCVRPEGRVMLVGMATKPLSFDGIALILNETELRACCAYSPADFSRAVDLLVSGAVPGGPLISRIADLDDVAEVFRDLEGPTTDLKVLLKP